MKIPALLGLPIAVAAGVLMPLQGRVNGALGAKLGDSFAAALVSFTTGLLLVAVLSVALPKGRQGLKTLRGELRTRELPAWYLLSGVIGAFYVLAQAVTIGLLGVALFTVAVVAGSMLGGLAVDRIGFGPIGRRRITFARALGAGMTLAAVAWAVSPRLGAVAGIAVLAGPLLMPFIGGLLQAPQQAMLGSMAAAARTPLTSTFLNFLGGAIVLFAAWLVKLAVAGAGAPLPGEWWYYLGGPLGCLFVAVSSVLVRAIGVLLMGLGIIGGQLLGSLALDAVLPVPGTVISLPTVLGTLLTLVAMVVATLPWPRGALRRSGSRRPGAQAQGGAARSEGRTENSAARTADENTEDSAEDARR